MGPGSDRSTARRDRDLKGTKEQEPKSVFQVENTSGNSQSTSPSCSRGERIHPGSCKSDAISCRCGGSRAQTRKNEERWPWCNRSGSAVERRHNRGCFTCGRRTCDSRDLLLCSLARVGFRSLVGVLPGLEGDAQKRGVGDADEGARLEVCDTF